MKITVRRAVSAVAMTSMAASMVACQSAPFAAPGSRVNAASVGGRAPSARAQALADAVHRGLDHIPGEFLVKLKPGASAQSAMAAASNTRGVSFQATPVGNTSSGAIVVMHANVGAIGASSAGGDAQQLSALRANPSVAYAEPNYIVKLNEPANEPMPLTAAPGPATNDPLLDKEWHIPKIDAAHGWAADAANMGNKDLILAVVDTGVDPNHPDLKDKLLPGWNTVDDNNDTTDGNGHGTHCVTNAAANTNNGIGIAGVAPNVKVLPVQVLSKDGYGSYDSVAAGIIWAADHGAKVISMSLGGPTPSPVVSDAVKHALEKDVLVVVAAGNSGPTAGPSYPAGEPGVMAIAATDSKDVRASFSQTGKHISVSAPGVNIFAGFPTYASQMPGKEYGAISGTSMATPMVAALGALVRSKYPQLKQAEVKALIEKTADDINTPGFDTMTGFGRINVFKALTTPPAVVLR